MVVGLDRTKEREEARRTNQTEIGIIRIITGQLRGNQPPCHTAPPTGEGKKPSTEMVQLCPP